MNQKYEKYIQSEHWRLLRGAKLQISPRCKRCNSKQDLEVHHWRYRKNLCDCTVNDLVTLCRFHHLGVHEDGWGKAECPQFVDYTQQKEAEVSIWVEPCGANQNKKFKAKR